MLYLWQKRLLMLSDFQGLRSQNEIFPRPLSKTQGRREGGGREGGGKLPRPPP
jgi:hypothetical protein